MQVSRAKSSSMATFLKHSTKQHAENHLAEQPPGRHPPELELPEKRPPELELPERQPFEKNFQKVEGHNAVNSMSKVQQRSLQHRNNQPEKHSLKSQKKQQQKAFCRPGSLSAFREFQKKQSENMIQENEIESTFSHKVAYECENTSTSANEQGLEIEPQLRHDENVVMDGRSEALSEKDSLAITTEIPKEGMIQYFL